MCRITQFDCPNLSEKVLDVKRSLAFLEISVGVIVNVFTRSWITPACYQWGSLWGSWRLGRLARSWE
jgi:hypothetical protein